MMIDVVVLLLIVIDSGVRFLTFFFGRINNTLMIVMKVMIFFSSNPAGQYLQMFINEHNFKFNSLK